MANGAKVKNELSVESGMENVMQVVAGRNDTQMDCETSAPLPPLPRPPPLSSVVAPLAPPAGPPFVPDCLPRIVRFCGVSSPSGEFTHLVDRLEQRAELLQHHVWQARHDAQMQHVMARAEKKLEAVRAELQQKFALELQQKAAIFDEYAERTEEMLWRRTWQGRYWHLRCGDLKEELSHASVDPYMVATA